LHRADCTLPPAADRVLISVNPKAGKASAGDRVEQLTRLLTRHGLQVDVLTDLAEVAAGANRWHTEGRLRALVGVGGDGTAAELVNRTDPGVPITLLAAGTENLLAKYLGLSESPETLVKMIAAGSILRLDAGRASGRIFLLMASCGFDADVVQRVHDLRKGHISHLTWIKPILKSIRRYQYPEIRVYWDQPDDNGAGSEPAESRPKHATVRWLFVFNLPCYGGGLRLAPEADGTDGLLDICTFRRGSLWHGLRYVAGVLLGRHQRMADCTTGRLRRLRVTSEGKVPYQLDGDPGGFLPVDIDVLPDRLTVLVPRCPRESD